MYFLYYSTYNTNKTTVTVSHCHTTETYKRSSGSSGGIRISPTDR